MSQSSFSESGNSPPSADPSPSADTRTSDKGVAGISVRDYLTDISVCQIDRYGNVTDVTEAFLERSKQSGGIKPSPANKD